MQKKVSIVVVFRMLNIDRKTIYAWMKRPSLQETPRLGKRPSFTDFDALADSIFKKQWSYRCKNHTTF